MRRDRKETIILIIILLVLGLGIGYAALTTTLTIDGTSDIDANTWNIYWNNVEVTDGSVTGDQVTTAPTINTDKTGVSFKIRLKEPGEFYEFTIDAKNDGTLNAMVDTITKTTNVPSYINYKVTYINDVEIQQYQRLNANTKEIYKVRVEYRTDINPNELPQSPQTLNLSFDVTYVQADTNAVPVLHTYYIGTRESFVRVGQSINTTTYNTYQQAIADINHPYFIKFEEVDGIVTKIYVGWLHNNQPYYLVSEAGDTAYEQNKATILSVFNPARCQENAELTPKYFACEDWGINKYADIKSDGLVEVYDLHAVCNAEPTSNGICTET